MEHLRGGLSSLMARFGVPASDTSDQVTAAAGRWLALQGLTASVVGLRWGTLTLRADAGTAHRLGWGKDSLIESVNDALGESVVESVRIHITQGDT